MSIAEIITIVGITIAFICTLVGWAFTYGMMKGKVIANSERITKMDEFLNNGLNKRLMEIYESIKNSNDNIKALNLRIDNLITYKKD